MNIDTIRRICLARHLFELAVGSLRSKNDLHLFSAVNLAQDAIETFLIAMADHVHVTFDLNTKFDKYFTNIDEKIAPKKLPFKSKLLRLNRVRVNSKHHGIQPAREECERLMASAREFMDEASVEHFGADFSTISAIDLLEDGECKEFLSLAKIALEQGNFESCLESCRKAIYIEIECYYNLSVYKSKEAGPMERLTIRAPYYARSMKYVADNVKSPTDYIVLDHDAVDRDLLKSGVNPTDFWNVWRLTPDVILDKRGTWHVKREFAKVDSAGLKDNAEYVFSTTIDIALARHSNRRITRWQKSNRYYVELAKGGVLIFSKADRSSQILATVPDGLSRLNTDYTVDGLNDDEKYWHIYDIENGLYGFICSDDVQSEV